VDDPSSCPEEFPTEDEQNRERDRLHSIIEAIVPWEASTNELSLHSARYEIARSIARNGGPALPIEWRKLTHARDVISYLQEHAPPVHDPFCGGASIPLEAQRLGLRARGSDLNPVAVIISKALVEFPPTFANLPPVNPNADRCRNWGSSEGLAEDVHYYGRWMLEEAHNRIGDLYPKVELPDGGEATVMAWLWARTVPSPDPRARGAHVPIASSFVISTKKGREAIVVPIVDRSSMTWRFEVNTKPTPQEIAAAKNGTKASRGYFTCILTGSPISYAEIDEVANSTGLRPRLMAIVAEGDRSRHFLPPTEAQERAALNLERPVVPLIEQPCRGTFGSNAQGRVYGFKTFADYFSSRQLTALATLSDLVSEVRAKVIVDARSCWFDKQTLEDQRSLEEGGRGPIARADAIATYLAFLITQLSNHSSSVCGWNSANVQMRSTFARQGLSMTWDYAECNIFSGSSGSFESLFGRMVKGFDGLAPYTAGYIKTTDAAENNFESSIFSTDPPYYDNMSYADLSDFFYVWMRRSLPFHSSLFRRVLTPKSAELVAEAYRHGGRGAAEKFFLDGMKKAIAGMTSASEDRLCTIYYAYKQSEASDDGVTSPGWTTFLQAVVDCGFMIDGTWPLRTEKPGRSTAIEASSLDSSIVHVCRRRSNDAESITRADFLRHLRTEMPDALAKIKAAGVGPTDVQQAAIGPGIGVFTRYAAVLNPDGSTMSVRDAVKLINQVREELASESQGDYDPATRFAIDWFMTHGNRPGRAGDAILMANALGLGLMDLERAGIFKAGEGSASLLTRDQLSNEWSPTTDRYPTGWEACQHLIKRLEAADGGINSAAALFAQLQDLAEPAHQLAFRLYDICNNKGWHSEAQPYNNLIQEWDVIEERSREFAPEPPAQGEMAL
jgi:putative DNA methylase